MKRFSSRRNRFAEEELIDADDEFLDIAEDADEVIAEEELLEADDDDVEVTEEVATVANRSASRLLRMASRVARTRGRINNLVRKRIAEDAAEIGNEIQSVCEGENCEAEDIVETAEELAETTAADIPSTADAVARVLAKYARKLRSSTEEVPIGEPVIADGETIGAEGAEEIKNAVARSLKRLASKIDKQRHPLTASQQRKIQSFLRKAAAKINAVEEGGEADDPKFTELVTNLRNNLKKLSPVKSKKTMVVDKAAPTTKFNMMTVEQVLEALVSLVNAQ